MIKTVHVKQPQDSPVKLMDKMRQHELIGSMVTGVRKIPFIDPNHVHGLFIEVNNQPYVCIDFNNSFYQSPGASRINISGSLLHGALVEAAIEYQNRLLIAVHTFTFALCPPNVKVQFVLPEAGEPDEVETDIGQPSASWIPIMQLVRQECSTCSHFLTGGCCERQCPVWDMKVKAHQYHKDLYQNPCDFCPKSPDKSFSIGTDDVGGRLDRLGSDRDLKGDCGKCSLQLKYGFGVAEGGEIKEYLITPEQILDLTRKARKKVHESKIQKPKSTGPKPWDKALKAVRK